MLRRAQGHPDWTKACETRLDLIQEMENWVRMNCARCERHLSKLGYCCPKCQHGMCTACNEIEGCIQCPRCMEPFPQVPHGHTQPAHSHVYTTQCLNIHALGEQWIEEVTDVEVVQTPQEECLEGENFKFKAHIRGWKTEIRKERCQQLLDKNDHNLRRALLRPLCKDVLLIPQAWYPEHKPKYETQGWWYVLLRQIHEGIHLQNTLEASGYRSPTWRIPAGTTSLLQSQGPHWGIDGHCSSLF